MRLGDVTHGRDNDIQCLRLVAAAAVMLFHSYVLHRAHGRRSVYPRDRRRPISASSASIASSCCRASSSRAAGSRGRSSPRSPPRACCASIRRSSLPWRCRSLLAGSVERRCRGATFITSPRRRSISRGATRSRGRSATLLPGAFLANPYPGAIERIAVDAARRAAALRRGRDRRAGRAARASATAARPRSCALVALFALEARMAAARIRTPRVGAQSRAALRAWRAAPMSRARRLRRSSLARRSPRAWPLYIGVIPADSVRGIAFTRDARVRHAEVLAYRSAHPVAALKLRGRYNRTGLYVAPFAIQQRVVALMAWHIDRRALAPGVRSRRSRWPRARGMARERPR